MKRVEFTVTRAEVWSWIKTIVIAMWRGGIRVKLHLDKENQTFIYESEVLEKNSQ